MAVTTSTNRELQNQYIERRFLEQLKPGLQFYNFATEGQVPGGMGDEIRWLNFPEMTVDTSALSETTATDNEITSYTADAVSGTISPYGQWIKISEQQAKTMVTGSLDQIAARLAYLGAKTVDTLLLNAADGATKYLKQGQTALNTSFITSTSTLTAATINYAETELTALGNMGFSSEGGKYAGIFAPAQIAALRAEPATSANNVTWSEINKYVAGQQTKLVNGDAGELFGVALKQTPLIAKEGFVETSGTNSSPATLSGYQGFVVAKDALGRAGIGDMEPSVLIKKPGNQDTSQPLNTFWTYGVKFRAAHKLLDTDRIIRVDSV